MKNSRTYGRTYAPLPFEIVPVPTLPAHDRESLSGVTVTCLPPYSPYPIGRKAEVARAFADTERMEIL